MISLVYPSIPAPGPTQPPPDSVNGALSGGRTAGPWLWLPTVIQLRN